MAAFSYVATRWGASEHWSFPVTSLLGTVAHNCSVQEAETRALLGVEASLDYRMRSRPDGLTQRDSQKQRKKTKKKEGKEKVTAALVSSWDPTLITLSTEGPDSRC